MYYADEAILVTNPEVSSVRDSDRMIGMLKSKSKRAEDGKEPIKEHLLITRYDPNRVEKGEMLNKGDIVDLLSIKLIGIIPESEEIIKASNNGEPAIREVGTTASTAYRDAVSRLLGEDVALKYAEQEKGGILNKILKMLGA